jgi:hypothetical protein
MTKRNAWAAGIGALVLLLAGCVDSATRVVVKTDGSGTIEKTIVLSRRLPELMQGMGTRGDAASIEAGLLNEAGLKAAAGRMGSGVSFVSAQKVSTDKGNGWRATYAFRDIAKVRISQNPAVDLTLPGTTGGATVTLTDTDSYSFSFVKGSPAVLTVNLPKPDTAASSSPAQQPQVDDPGMMESVRAIYEDMRIVLVVQAAGTITQTNAQFTSGADVTLLDMDFGKFLADDATWKKLTGMQGTSFAEVQGLVKALPGVKIEFQNPVKISFR